MNPPRPRLNITNDHSVFSLLDVGTCWRLFRKSRLLLFVLVVQYLFWLYDVCLVVGLGFLSMCSRPLFCPLFVCLFVCSFSLVRHVYVVVARSVEIPACLIKALSHRVVLVPCLTIHLLA